MKINEDNRWIKLSSLVSRDNLATLHNLYFDKKKITIGLLILKTTLETRFMPSSRIISSLNEKDSCTDGYIRIFSSKIYTLRSNDINRVSNAIFRLIEKVKLGLADKEILNYFYETLNFQYFCGFDNFISKKNKIMDSSFLAKKRNKLEKKYFLECGNKILEILKKQKLVKGEELLLDIKIFNSKDSYTNYTKFINVIRTYCINKIMTLKKTLKFKILSSFSLLFFVSSCVSIVEENAAKLVFSDSINKKSFSFIVSEKFVKDNSKSKLSPFFSQINVAELKLLMSLLKKNNYCIDKDGELSFRINSKQAEVRDITFLSVIEHSYNAKPTSPAIYFGECLRNN